MLVCKVCGSILITVKGEWACAFSTYAPEMAQQMYEKPHTKEPDKRVNA